MTFFNRGHVFDDVMIKKKREMKLANGVYLWQAKNHAVFIDLVHKFNSVLNDEKYRFIKKLLEE